MGVKGIVIFLVVLLLLVVTGSIRVSAHHTGVPCGPESNPGRSVCLPFADDSYAVNKLKATNTLTYCFNQRALNYPGFRAQVRETLTQHESVLGIKHIEVAGAYQSNTAAGNAGCDVWHSMPETHGCPQCGAWVHYLNEPVIIEYRWQAGYSDWKTTITHEVGHIYGLHEQYDDANFRSHRGSYGYWAKGMETTPGTATDARTVMDFGMSSLYGNLAWQFSEWDVKYACENMDPTGQFIPGCMDEESVECALVGYDPCTDRHIMPDGWSYSYPEDAWYSPTGVKVWGGCTSYGARYNVQLDRWVLNWQVYDWDYGWHTMPNC